MRWIIVVLTMALLAGCGARAGFFGHASPEEMAAIEREKRAEQEAEQARERAIREMPVYYTKAPDRPYEELQLLSAASGGFADDESLIYSLKTQAYDLGADALVMMGMATETTGGSFVGDHFIAHDRRLARGVAIRFLDSATAAETSP